MKRTPLRKKRKGPPRKGRFYDRPYMDWIASLSCCACGQYGCDPAHTKALGAKGMGQKTSDRSCIPLCRSCHHEFDHGKNRKTFLPDHGVDVVDLVIKLNLRYAEERELFQINDHTADSYQAA